MTISREVVWPLRQVTQFWKPSNETFAGVHDPLLALGYVSLAYNEEDRPASGLRVVQAEQCILNPCAQEYEVTTRDGLPNSAVVSTSYGEISLHRFPTFDQGQMEQNSVQTKTCWQADPEDVTFSLIGSNMFTNEQANSTNYAYCPVQDFRRPISSKLSGRGSTRYYAGLSTGELNVSDWILSPSDLDELISSETSEIEYSSEGVQSVAAKGLKYVVDSVAASLTNLALDLDDKSVVGNVTTSELYVHVQWEWLVLPFALEIVGVALFVTTILLSYRHEIQLWRSSALAHIYHGLDERHR